MSGEIEVTYRLDPADWQALVLKLNELAGNKTRTYIARALNKTAVSARVKLGNKAQASYTVKTGGFKQDMQIDKANEGNLVATIRSHGDTLDVPKFHWSSGGKSGVKIDVVRSGLKPLTLNGNKAFVRKIGKTKYDKKTKRSEKVMRKNRSTGEMEQATANLVFARVGKSRLPIWKMKSKSVPYMIGSDNRVYGPLKPKIQSDLKKYMNQQIAMLLG